MEELKDRKRRLDEERNNNDLVEETRSTGWRKSVRSKRGDAAQKAPAQPERGKQPFRVHGNRALALGFDLLLSQPAGNKRKKVQPPTGPKINFKYVRNAGRSGVLSSVQFVLTAEPSLKSEHSLTICAKCFGSPDSRTLRSAKMFYLSRHDKPEARRAEVQAAERRRLARCIT